MGLKSWLVRHKLQAQIRLWQIQMDAEREKLAGEKEVGMPVWLHTLAVVFGGGALAAAADALANGFTVDKAGLTRLASAALAGGLVALVAWLKQSPLAPKAPDAGPPRDANGKLLVLLLCLGLIPLAGCASGQVRLGREPRPLAPDPEVVESLVCAGNEDGAARYIELRAGSLADRIEFVERARKATKNKPGCCLADGKCAQ